MCGRYQFTIEQHSEILQIIQVVNRRYGADAWMPGEIRPTTAAPVLVASQGKISPELYIWGYKLPGTLVINARAESAAEKPLFRGSVVSQRCVVPSTGFFEWDGEKRKYLFTMPGESILYMAGLYSIREGKPHCCILTTQANASMKGVHQRMPLVLQRDQISHWLTHPEMANEFLGAVPPMLEKKSVDAQIKIDLW